VLSAIAEASPLHHVLSLVFVLFLGTLPLMSVYDSLHGVPGIVHDLVCVRFV
jgi:hypothetical protein